MQYAANAIRTCPALHCPPIVSVVENAPGIVGPEMHEYLLDMAGVCTMREWGSNPDIYGVPPHAAIRDRQTVRMENLLSQGLVVYSENCMTYPASGGGRSLGELKRLSGVQLMAWERIVEWNPNKPLMKPKTGWSGKRLAGNDDLAVVFLMACQWPEVFFSDQRSDRYGDFVREYIAPRISSRVGTATAGDLLRTGNLGPAEASWDRLQKKGLPAPSKHHQQQHQAQQPTFRSALLTKTTK